MTNESWDRILKAREIESGIANLENAFEIMVKDCYHYPGILAGSKKKSKHMKTDGYHVAEELGLDYKYINRRGRRMRR
ncbi:MAG: hypothetical protein ACW96U_00755 [Candidatus Heimdallarchaeaceae archaeon]|jgi:hypothetical protein